LVTEQTILKMTPQWQLDVLLHGNTHTIRKTWGTIDRISTL